MKIILIKMEEWNVPPFYRIWPSLVSLCCRLMMSAPDFFLYLPATLSVILAKVCQRYIPIYILWIQKRVMARKAFHGNGHNVRCLHTVVWKLWMEEIVISNQLILALLLGCLCQLSCGWISTSSTSAPKPIRNNRSHHGINGVVSFISLRRPTSIIWERQSIAQNVRECTRIQKQ